MEIVGRLFSDSSKWASVDAVISLLLRNFPERFDINLIEIYNEDDFFRVVYDGMVIREIEPYVSRRMKCYFEDISFIEFSMEELEVILKAMPLGT